MEHMGCFRDTGEQDMSKEYVIKVTTGWDVEESFGTRAEAEEFAACHCGPSQKAVVEERETRKSAWRLNTVPDKSPAGQALVRELRRKLKDCGEAELGFTCMGFTREQMQLGQSATLLTEEFPDCKVFHMDGKVVISPR